MQVRDSIGDPRCLLATLVRLTVSLFLLHKCIAITHTLYENPIVYSMSYSGSVLDSETMHAVILFMHHYDRQIL